MISPARCGVVPLPGLAQFSLSGFALAKAISSGRLRKRLSGRTARTLGEAPSVEIGTKSRNGS